MLLAQSLKDLFYPPLCLSCKQWLIKGESSLCFACLSQLPETRYTIDTKNPVAQILWGRIPLKYACSFLIFNQLNHTHDILHNIKYKGNKELAKYLGKHYATAYLKQLELLKIDEIIPIPLHPRKKRIRGFNQAEYFAQGMAEILQCICNTGGLKRRSFTATQTKKSRAERWENVREVFICTTPELAHKNILLVDDVITTGATLESAALALLKKKPKSIGVITLAFAND